MKIQVKGRNVAVTDALQGYAEEKLARVHRLLQERHIDEVSRVELELTVEKNPSIASPNVAEATIFTRGPVIRAKESSADMYASIDLVADKLQRRVKKYHDKMQHKNLRHAGAKQAPESAQAAADSDEAAAAAEFRRRGDPHHHRPRPRGQEQAVRAQADCRWKRPRCSSSLWGTISSCSLMPRPTNTNVVYRRRDGHYGLIEPQRG